MKKVYTMGLPNNKAGSVLQYKFLLAEKVQ